ncbi:hypothetical protein TcG_02441 [Trypanosoma cruzi]|uniref:Uncharacterized protein n=2 Tax=Trypanosoma cruzi TaxID=5693 RepID=V5BA10_TRYCR|nr:hypothetical protein TCDM_01203 [Trypanosoma cruzi Dm28c]KAF8288859.1 hypothetical protein TcBrA4_0003610 [Trypanosoma cruzi]PBJ71919.1 hypothetical protein BCY84_16139 [Trypanosoma cruzi cruzi]PWU98143.1 hypothetical protein C4B63_13g123 [Trypanosoma cruzi]RNF22300.1 hypothetical protein TcG_02441 [Trypanosoma cruzi]
MYGDGDRKTISELRRDAAAVRRRILDQTVQLQRVQNATARASRLIDQLLRLFATEVTENDRDALFAVLASISEDLDFSNVPLIPIAIALANDHFSNVKRIRAVRNRFLDDNSVIFLAHVLRFSPSLSQVELLDISGTRVTEKGLFFLLEMMEERETPFALIAKDRVPTEIPVAVEFMQKYQLALRKVGRKSNCALTL